MRRLKTKRAKLREAEAEPSALAGTEFLLSIVEEHHSRRNGNVITMESGIKARQELDKIEQQLARLKSREGQGEETQRRDPAIARTGQRVEARRDSAVGGVGANHPGAASAAALHARLHRAHFYRLERDSRRPRIPRRSGDCLRHGAVSRRRCDGSRAAESAGCEAARVSELWHAASGGISQGAAGDADCGEIWQAGSQLSWIPTEPIRG